MNKVQELSNSKYEIPIARKILVINVPPDRES
jgi:hypothetical protein